MTTHMKPAIREPTAEVIASIQDVTGAIPQVRLAALFGSRARGDPADRSDVDVAILLDDNAPDTILTDIEVTLGRSLGRAVDVVDLRNAPPLLRFEVARDGKLAVSREAHLWSDFRARAMIDWWDWAPTARLIQNRIIERLRRKAGDAPA